MKKLLALVLALVMTMGLATVGTKAEMAADYKDADKINDKYVEAISVMNAIGVFIGDDGGNFRPTDTMKRSEVAKVVAILMSDNKTVKDQVGTGLKYSDLPANHWASGCIEMLTALGVMAGVGDGRVNPDGDMRTIDYAKMLLVALGFDAKIEGLVGPDYQIYTNALANQFGLFHGNDDVNITAPVTREEAALYAFNAIKSPMVKYASKSTNINVNGADITFGGSNWDYMTTTEQTARYRAINNVTVNGNNQAQIVEFAEQHFPGLRLDRTTDAWGRPANHWSLNSVDIDTFADYEYLTKVWYTSLTGKMLFEELGEAVIKNSTVKQYTNGRDVSGQDILPTTMNRANVTSYTGPGKGARTEMYVIPGVNEIQLIFVTIDTYFAQATKDFNEKTGNLELKVFNNGRWADGTRYLVNVDDVPSVKDVKKGDYLVVNMLWDKNTNNSVVTVAKPKSVKEKVELNAWVEGANSFQGKDGTSYSANRRMNGLDTPMAEGFGESVALNVTYNIFFESNDLVIGLRANMVALPYLFLTGYDTNGSHISASEVNASVILKDGTMKTVKINVPASDKQIRNFNTKGAGKDEAALQYAPFVLTGAEDPADFGYADQDAMQCRYNRWFAYSVVDGVYTLYPVSRWGTLATPADDVEAGKSSINPSKARLDSNTTSILGYGNDDSTYITVNAGASGIAGEDTIKSVTGVYTGVQTIDIQMFNTTDDVREDALGASNDFTEACYFFTDASSYIIAAVCLGKDTANTKNFVFVLTYGSSWIEYTDGKYYYWDFDAIVNGEQKTLTIKSKFKDIDPDIQVVANDPFSAPSLYRMSFDRDGYVSEVERVHDVLNGGFGTGGKVYTNDNFKADVDAGRRPDLATFNALDLITPFCQLRKATGNTLFFIYNDEDEETLDGAGEYDGEHTLGIVVKSGAPVYVEQFVIYNLGLAGQKPSIEVEQFDSVAEAVRYLADFDNETGNDELIGFSGEIVAAINKDTGIAQWVVLKSFNARVINATNEVVTGSAFLNLSLTKLNGVGMGMLRSTVGIQSIQIVEIEQTAGGPVVNVRYDGQVNAADKGLREIDITKYSAFTAGHTYFVIVNGKYQSNTTTAAMNFYLGI